MTLVLHMRIFIITVFTLWMSNVVISDPRSTDPAYSLNFCKHCVCGVSWPKPPKKKNRIVNGKEIFFEEFPWMVQIKYHGQHHCGGSLITSRHILTAAHCLKNIQKNHLQKNLSVRLADNATYEIQSLKVHERFEQQTYNNDIAIIELVRPMPLGGAVKMLVYLIPVTTFNSPDMGVSSGWGHVAQGVPGVQKLRKVYLPIMSKEQCLKSHWRNGHLTDNMFCAGYLDGIADTCQGDSGGPLLRRKIGGSLEVVGIVSFGVGCAKRNFPGIYTKVTNYLGWIGQHLHNECLCSPLNWRRNKQR